MNSHRSASGAAPMVLCNPAGYNTLETGKAAQETWTKNDKYDEVLQTIERDLVVHIDFLGEHSRGLTVLFTSKGRDRRELLRPVRSQLVCFLETIRARFGMANSMRKEEARSHGSRIALELKNHDNSCYVRALGLQGAIEKNLEYLKWSILAKDMDPSIIEDLAKKFELCRKELDAIEKDLHEDTIQALVKGRPTNGRPRGASVGRT